MYFRNILYSLTQTVDSVPFSDYEVWKPLAEWKWFLSLHKVLIPFYLGSSDKTSPISAISSLPPVLHYLVAPFIIILALYVLCMMQNSIYLTEFSCTEKQTHSVHRSFPMCFRHSWIIERKGTVNRMCLLLSAWNLLDRLSKSNIIS